jgi:peptide/nickel transport system permease protein
VATPAPRDGRRRLAARLLQALAVVWAAASLAFLLLRLAPGDPYSRGLDGLALSPEARAALRAQRGLDQPLGVQYGRWLGRTVRGDFGWSTHHQRPVAAVLRERLPRTLALMALALLTSLAAGLALGAWQGGRPDGAGDDLATTVTLLVLAMPEFWLAMLLLQLFVQGLGWLPAGGMVSATHEYLGPAAQWRDRLAHLVLPWLTLSLVGTAAFARFQRASLREVRDAPFVRTARAKGLTDARVRWHAWRTALTPVVGLAGLTVPALLGGAVFVERLFAWPGMGSATVAAVEARDHEFVTAAVIVGSVMTVAGSLLADLVQQRLDPRVRP